MSLCQAEASDELPGDGHADIQGEYRDSLDAQCKDDGHTDVRGEYGDYVDAQCEDDGYMDVAEASASSSSAGGQGINPHARAYPTPSDPRERPTHATTLAIITQEPRENLVSIKQEPREN